MSIKKLFAVLCAMLLSLTIMPLGEAQSLKAKAAVQAVWPVDAEFDEITTFFNPNRNNGGLYGGHNGIDVPADCNSNIYAVADGVCVSAGWMGDYGNLIVIRHENLGIYTFYAHCNSYYVWAGQSVSAGDIIGTVGNTGNSYGNHLHFGICDTLLGGYPTATYYDPLAYFTYASDYNPNLSTTPTVPEINNNQDNSTVTPPATSDVCNCSTDYAGSYVTKNITTYLNIRSGHSSNFSIVGKLYPTDYFEVTKADGKWAHIRFGEITGYVSMEYIQKLTTVESGRTLSSAVVPKSEISVGKPADVGGIINSNLPITRFTGGIYASDRTTPIYEFEKNPNTLTYNLTGEFDESMLFDKLTAGTYYYKAEAEDSSGKVYSLIGVEFTVVQPIVAGDVNCDGNITISDGVLMQKYLLGNQELSENQLKSADVTGDSWVDIFDMIIIKEMLSIVN